MDQMLRLFLVQGRSPKPYAYVGDLQPVVGLSTTKTVQLLEKTVPEHIVCTPNSSPEEGGVKVEDTDFVVHRVRGKQISMQPFGGYEVEVITVLEVARTKGGCSNVSFIEEPLGGSFSNRQFPYPSGVVQPGNWKLVGILGP